MRAFSSAHCSRATRDTQKRGHWLKPPGGATCWRVHDARHAAAAIVAGIKSVFTYDASDWESFEGDELSIAGPLTTLARLGRS